MSIDHRQAASGRTTDLVNLLRAQPSDPALARLVEEAEALGRAIAAFHLEGIRFRMYNVDRLLSPMAGSLPAESGQMFDDIRHHLEAAGFHTRSHQAPG
ncbi:MAG TPA: hypothetical protein VFX12_00380 [Vicinamibacterales bacterium]|nr:hypothetical protein [Vicinamibacterales bacterium]